MMISGYVFFTPALYMTVIWSLWIAHVSSQDKSEDILGVFNQQQLDKRSDQIHDHDKDDPEIMFGCQL